MTVSYNSVNMAAWTNQGGHLTSSRSGSMSPWRWTTPGRPAARVRAVPDRRAIRWYTTIGLIDRPVAHRGRTALYGPRHLLQLVAVKRLQARACPWSPSSRSWPAPPTPSSPGSPASPARRPRRAPGRSAAPAAVACSRARTPPPHRPRRQRARGPVAARGVAGSGASRLPPSPPPPSPSTGAPDPNRWPRPCGGCVSGKGRPCCWNRGGSWMRRTCKPSSTPPGRCWPCSGNAASAAPEARVPGPPSA